MGRWRVVGGLGLRETLILRQRKGGRAPGPPARRVIGSDLRACQFRPVVKGGAGGVERGGGCPEPLVRPTDGMKPLEGHAVLSDFLVEAPHLPSSLKAGPRRGQIGGSRPAGPAEEKGEEGARDRKEANHQI